MATNDKPHRIAIIPGDGIGKEVMPEGVRVLEAVARRFGIAFEFVPIEWASCDYHAQHGTMMPDDWNAQLTACDAIFFGAVGWPALIPDHVSLWGSLIKFRREFDQYVNLRPCAADARRAIAARRSRRPCARAGRDRLLRRPREHRRRVLEHRRAHVSRHRSRGRHAGDGDEPHRRRSHREVRVRARAASTEEAPDVGDEVERDLDHDAVLGRADRGDGEAVSRRDGGSLSHRHPHRELRAASRVVRRRGRVEPVRRHPV